MHTDPIYSGVRLGVKGIKDNGYYSYLIDLPFSCILDTALLPITIPYHYKTEPLRAKRELRKNDPYYKIHNTPELRKAEKKLREKRLEIEEEERSIELIAAKNEERKRKFELLETEKMFFMASIDHLIKTRQYSKAQAHFDFFREFNDLDLLELENSMKELLKNKDVR